MNQIKHYAELYYPSEFDTDKSIETLVINDSITKTKDIPVEERNPLVIPNDGKIIGFRFYSVREIEMYGETLRGDKKEFSGMYYFGKRALLKDIVNTMPSYPAHLLLEKLGHNYHSELIACSNKTFITDIKDNDMTIEEAQAQIKAKEQKEIKIERKAFFTAIAEILSTFEVKTYSCQENTDKSSWYIDDDQCFDCGTKEFRTYTIVSEEKEVVSHKMTSNIFYSDDLPATYLDEFVKYKDLEEVVESLKKQYPYLFYFIDEILDICYKNDGHLPEKEVIKLISSYANNAYAPEERCIILDKILSLKLAK